MSKSLVVPVLVAALGAAAAAGRGRRQKVIVAASDQSVKTAIRPLASE